MPQMMPMEWTLILIFSLMSLLITIMLFYSMIFSNKTSMNKAHMSTSISILNWTWKWY